MANFHSSLARRMELTNFLYKTDHYLTEKFQPQILFLSHPFLYKYLRVTFSILHFFWSSFCFRKLQSLAIKNVTRLKIYNIYLLSNWYPPTEPRITKKKNFLRKDALNRFSRSALFPWSQFVKNRFSSSKSFQRSTFRLHPGFSCFSKSRLPPSHSF